MRSFFFERHVWCSSCKSSYLLFAFSERPLTWVSKLILLSIWTPSNFSQMLSFARDSPTRISIGSLVLIIKYQTEFICISFHFILREPLKQFFCWFLARWDYIIYVITRIIYSIIISIARKINVINHDEQST